MVKKMRDAYVIQEFCFVFFVFFFSAKKENEKKNASYNGLS